MGLFTIDPEKKAERLRRRAQRKQSRVDAVEAKADAFDPPEEESIEEAQIEVTNKAGHPVRQNVRLRKKGSRMRNKRIKGLEKQVADLEAKVEDLTEDLEGALAALEKWHENRTKTNTIFGTATLGAANALISFINMSDKVQNPLALAGSEALDALSDTKIIEKDQKVWARVLRVALKGLAYYDAEKGFSSVFQSDSPTTTTTEPVHM